MPDAKPLAATVEDYDSDADEALDSSTNLKPLRPPPVSTARNVIVDAASDSGYSSRTAATLGSADSIDATPKPTAMPGAPPLSPDEPAVAAAGSRKKKLSPELKPRPRPPSRPTSRSISTPVSDQQFQRCTDPKCKGCNVSRRPTPSPLEAPWNNQYVRHPISPVYPPHLPPSPHPYSQPSAYHPAAGPFATVAQPRKPSSSSKRRPLSYHPGTMPEGYWVPVATKPAFEHGPPPAPSAYANLLMSPSAYSLYAPHQAGPSMYPAQIHSHPHLQQTTHRPALAQRATDTYITQQHPASIYNAQPLVSYDHNGYATALVRRPSTSQRSPGPPAYDLYYYDDADRQRMPPPPRPQEAPRARSLSRRRAEKPAYYSSEHYERDRHSDSSTSDADATIHARSTHSRQTAVPSKPSGNERTERRKSDAREYMESTRGRRRSYASHEQQRSADRRGSTESEPYSERLRLVRTTSRPARLTEEVLEDSGNKTLEAKYGTNSRRQSRSRSRLGASREGSNISKSASDGLKIEVDRKGMNLNLNGQKISVMPKADGTAELIIAAQKPDVKYVEGSRTQSSGSSRRKSRSSKSSSDVGPTSTNDIATASRSSRQAAVAINEN